MPKPIKVIAYLTISLVAGYFSLFIVAPVINNTALAMYRAEIVNGLELSLESEVVEIVSACGNTGGTGDHAELYVAILIKSSLAEDSKIQDNPDTVWDDRYSTREMWLCGLDFSEATPDDCYYIVDGVKSTSFMV